MSLLIVTVLEEVKKLYSASKFLSEGMISIFILSLLFSYLFVKFLLSTLFVLRVDFLKTLNLLLTLLSYYFRSIIVGKVVHFLRLAPFDFLVVEDFFHNPISFLKDFNFQSLAIPFQS